MKKYNVGIIGCGAIFNRHVLAINENKNKFNLVAICDNNPDVLKGIDTAAKKFLDYKEMLLKTKINFVVIASPNGFHKEQAINSLKNGCDVLIEKPAALFSKCVKDILKAAKKFNQKAYCVLQVRKNDTVSIIKNCLSNNFLGEIRSISLTQRWQRPHSYFDGWRNNPKIGGGLLHEIGIHYLDIVQYLFGMPKIIAAKCYKTKHIKSNIEDTVYALCDYGKFGGTIEISISSEPYNLQCEIDIIASEGFVRLGGKALEEITDFKFISKQKEKEFIQILSQYNFKKEYNNYGTHTGSCPNHSDVYKNLNEFLIDETINSVKLIEDVYNNAKIKY